MVINCKVLPWIVAGIALAAILLIVLVMVTQAAPYQSRLYTTNLLANPGFEYGLTGWSVGYYSTQVTISLGSGLCPVHCGSYAAQGTPTYNDDAYVTQTFQWDGGDLYASAWMQSRYFDGYVHGYVALDGPNDEHVISEIDLTWNEWRRISISQTGAASGTWTVSAGTPKSIYDLSAWIDDVWVGDMDNTNPCMQPIPQLVSYQGQVDIGGMPFSGTGYFRFAIVDPSGTFYFWSNDGTDAITPTNAVTLTVVDGIFNTLLGETNPITYGVFSDSDRWLRVWFDDGTHGIQLLEPDTQFTTAPFAFQADHSTTADTATSAAYAITAGDATTALNATNAMTATYATTAGDATTALTATNATTATYATTALTATNATTATYATTALTATNATTATYATTALTATNATTATYATTALTATNATTATYATTALTATNATTATYATTALTATNATTASYASTVPGFIIVKLATPATAINTTLSTVGTSTEITNTTLGIPSNAKGVLYELTISDSGAVAQFFRMGPTAAYFYQATLTNQVINVSIRDNGICFTDSNGSIWYRSQASGSNTLTVLMRVWGYLQ